MEPSTMLKQEVSPVEEEAMGPSPKKRCTEDMVSEAPVKVKEEGEAPVRVKEEGEAPVRVKEERESPVRVKEERESSVRVKEEGEAPVRVKEERESPVRVKEERESPVRVKEERESPVRVKEERQSPVRVKEERQSPVRVKEERQSPVRVKEERQSPVRVKEERESPVRVKEECESPVRVKEERQSPVRVKEEREAPVRVKEEDVSDNEEAQVGMTEGDSKPPTVFLRKCDKKRLKSQAEDASPQGSLAGGALHLKEEIKVEAAEESVSLEHSASTANAPATSSLAISCYVLPLGPEEANQEIKYALMAEIRRFGRHYGRIFELLEEVQGPLEVQIQFVKFAIKEAARFKRYHLISYLDEMLDKLMSESTIRGNLNLSA